jgi:hypothetical protein
LPKILPSNLVRRVVDALRGAEHAPDAWPDGLKWLTESLNVAGAACIIFNKKTWGVDWACFSGLSSELERRYIDHYAALDPFSPLLNATPGWTRLLACLPASNLAKSEWYNDFVLSCGVRDIIGAKLVDSQSHVGICGLHQQIGRDFADLDPAMLDSLTGPLISATRRRVETFSVPPTEEYATKTASVGNRRYFFHVCNGENYVDPSGQLFAFPEEAVICATQLAAELSHDEGWRGFEVCVTDETGCVIDRRPIHPRDT